MSLVLEADKAWLACAIDGEGSVVIRKGYVKGKGPIYFPIVSVNNTDARFIEKSRSLFVDLCGGCSSRNVVHANGWKPVYRVEVSSFKRVVPLLETILPYLIIKYDRAKNVLAWHRHRSSGRRGRPYDDGDIAFIKVGREIGTSKWRNGKTLGRIDAPSPSGVDCIQ